MKITLKFEKQNLKFRILIEKQNYTDQMHLSRHKLFSDLKTGCYNANIITKLVRNFRSHPAILKIPSALFYDSELIPMAGPTKTDSFLSWSELPKFGFPIIFEGLIGQDNREPNNPSYFNAEEATIVVQYLEKLLTLDQIGIEKVNSLGRVLCRTVDTFLVLNMVLKLPDIKINFRKKQETLKILVGKHYKFKEYIVLETTTIIYLVRNDMVV